MYKYTKAQAEEFFKALRQASIEMLDYYKLPTSPGNKTRKWRYGYPVGVTEHFTAGVTWKGSISWLSGKDNQTSSCHMVILDRKLGEVDSIFSKYPILDSLPVTAILLADLDKATWHCGWGNEFNFGIENRNAGRLKGTQGAWTWWPNGYTKAFPHKELGKTPVNIDGVWWEPYTYGQIVANIIVCQYLHCFFQDKGGVNPSWFIPHSALSGGKSDTGRAFPLQAVRDAVIDQTEIENLMWLHDFKADPQFMDDYEEEEDADFIQQLKERQGDRQDDWFDDENLLVTPNIDIQMLVQDGYWKNELDAIRRALTKLGYVTDKSGPELDAVTALAVFQFQTSVDLKPDKIPGPVTQEALYKRLKDFQLEK